jgi:hypothetical protein
MTTATITPDLNRRMDKYEHGSPWDRGSADAWYGRSAHPHKYPNGTYVPPCIDLQPGTEEWDEYMEAYNTEPFNQKDWGTE